MKLHIIGCYAATPRVLTNPTAQVLTVRNRLFLIDCGEGTQVQLRKNKIKFSRIEHIFISHLHGDHFFGLPGLITTFRLLGRDKPLHIYGPAGIKEGITLLLKLGNAWTDYELHFHELSSTSSELIYEDDDTTVHTIPLDHRIYTNGFLFREKPLERNLLYETARSMGIGHDQFQAIKAGEDGILPDGERIPNNKLTQDPPAVKSYAYCSDTAFNRDIIPQIKGVNALYHDATFLETEADLARKTKHTTAMDAARLAREAGVGKLILGHYSTRYKDINSFADEARGIFPEIELAEDGKVIDIT